MVGVPKTIDNDISYVYQTFGVDTAVTIARQAVRAAHSEAASAYNAIGLVKLMGRESGFIAALTTIAANDVNLCLIPEVPFFIEGEGGVLDILEKSVYSIGFQGINHDLGIDPSPRGPQDRPP